MGVIGTITQGCYIKGMEIGDAAAMAPIDYTRLVFAVARACCCSTRFPGLAVLLGAAIVVISTLFITWREHQAAEQAAQGVGAQPA
jgi:drug/metabolite transporter (DMT)-like permease